MQKQRRTRLKRCERRKRTGVVLCAGWRGGRRSDHHPFKPRSWSGARETAVEMERLFKAVTPPLKKKRKRGSQGPPPSSFLRGRRRCLARLAESTLCAKLEAFVLLFYRENTLIRTRECLFRKLIGSNRWEMKS